MARIGFKKAKYNPIDYETKKYKTLGSGSSVPSMVKVIDEKFAPEFNSAELYADDILAESDYTFKKGSLTITVEDDNDTIEAQLMGNTIQNGSEGKSGEVTRNISDNAPECGYGHIICKMVGGVRKWKVEFFPRVKFTKITADAKTRGESVEFGTATIEAVVYPLGEEINGMSAGTWEKHKTFDTEASAEEYLIACLTPSV